MGVCLVFGVQAGYGLPITLNEDCYIFEMRIPRMKK